MMKKYSYFKIFINVTRILLTYNLLLLKNKSLILIVMVKTNSIRLN